LFAACRRVNFKPVNVKQENLEAPQRRLELARQAFKEFYAQCFWSSDPEHLVEEADIPWIIRNLRQNGGHRGYRIVAELCR
jgi:hypothetical protein